MPTMDISLTSELASFVEGEVRSGRYTSSSELVRAGLRLLAQQAALDREELALVKAQVAEGLADLRAGRLAERSVAEIALDVLSASRRAG